MAADIGVEAAAYRIGYVGHGTDRALIVCSSVFMDYADSYLLDRTGAPSSTALWGTGVGGVASLGRTMKRIYCFPFRC